MGGRLKPPGTAGDVQCSAACGNVWQYGVHLQAADGRQQALASTIFSFDVPV